MSDARDVSAGQERRRPVLDSYGRLSRVPETGELEKVETQWADNAKVIERVGGTLGEQLKDGLSAWKRGVRRAGWERLLERVKSGESDGIVVWHTDRLFRQPRDLEALINLANRGFRVYSAHGERDLADPDDRYILRIEVAHAARSSDDTSRRLKRRFRVFRDSGRGHTGGARRFGFPGLEHAPNKPKSKRRPVPAELVERERQAIREAAKDLLAGVSLNQIVRDWNAAELRTAAGREWVPESLKSTLQRPSLAGLIEHDGVVVGRMEGEPILDQRTYGRVQALFAGRKRGRVAGESYVGTGILRCGNCRNATKLTAHRQKPKTYPDGTVRATYYCSKQRRGCGKVYADRLAVDTELMAFTVRRLSDERHAAAVAAARSKVAERLAQVNDEIEQCEAVQRALSDRLGRRQISLDAFDSANEPLAADLARLTAERKALSSGTPDGPTHALNPDALIAEWIEGTVAEKRAMLTSALGRDRIVIDPATKTGKRVFDRSRIRLVRPGEQGGGTLAEADAE